MKVIYSTILTGLFATLMACSGEADKNKKVLKSAKEHSELGLLMRDIFDDAEHMKAAIKEGRKAEPTVAYKDILSAQPSEPEKTSSPEYDALSQQYFQAMARLETASEEDAIKAFESMVGTCIDCHKTACPGVIKKIKRLYY
jgi:hypothetical protein